MVCRDSNSCYRSRGQNGYLHGVGKGFDWSGVSKFVLRWRIISWGFILSLKRVNVGKIRDNTEPDADR